MMTDAEGKGHGKLASEVAPEPVSIGSIFDLLANEHRHIMELFNAIVDTDSKTVAPALKVFSELQEELMTHLEGEERFFFSALEIDDDLSEKVLEEYEQHHIAKTLLASFNSLAVDDHRWKAKIKVLWKLFQFHVTDEDLLIQKARLLFPEGKAREMARQFLEFRGKGGSTKAVGEPVADL
ncbi:hemerythrin domain-containing protein [Geomesophilobacter sediminis]|uniref:Hemerythrin domain-containing protein n=1 Tax=Geomesophilobacter sediminis TaxID=2798584 RepID=A0A8J7M4L6_9BACT|nr:hemerythrin domain-containing protein [Geomesophilobacter sediminis]MBJ6728011.1 hemerythrin domain-containing protein [Geomesophilobacter sediminis]